MKPILEIHNLSKKFLIDHERPSYLSLRDRMASSFKSTPRPDEFWALRDVSFNVMPGESVGIIGRNGAGKSTLLKTLSRITLPTEGHIIIRGRIASLLEVGTGFHQELTGRENIFMNGSILGMKRVEIKNRFDEIIDFSGVEKFLDTPLKNYSSGMQLRLAFAVAAHLEPEILIVDEVLAVGDFEFQKKCLKKMEDVTNMGKTVLMVSHNMEATRALCKRGILLADGHLKMDGLMLDVIDTYEGVSIASSVQLKSGIVKDISIEQENESLLIKLSYSSEKEIEFPNLGFSISDQFGYPISGTNPVKAGLDMKNYIPKKTGSIKIRLHSPKLADGKYLLRIWFGDEKQNFFETKDPLVFHVHRMATSFNRTSRIDGFVVPECEWTFND